jgi:hypothetical protein
VLKVGLWSLVLSVVSVFSSSGSDVGEVGAVLLHAVIQPAEMAMIMNFFISTPLL